MGQFLRHRRANEKTIEAFGTPTVVHFGAVLLQSAIMTAPWPSLPGARIALAAYGGIAASTLGLAAWPVRMFFTIAGAALLLLFVGLHNAWDTVTFVVVTRPGKPEEKKPQSERKARHH